MGLSDYLKISCLLFSNHCDIIVYRKYTKRNHCRLSTWLEGWSSYLNNWRWTQSKVAKIVSQVKKKIKLTLDRKSKGEITCWSLLCELDYTVNTNISKDHLTHPISDHWNFQQLGGQSSFVNSRLFITFMFIYWKCNWNNMLVIIWLILKENHYTKHYDMEVSFDTNNKSKSREKQQIKVESLTSNHSCLSVEPKIPSRRLPAQNSGKPR